MYRAVHHIQTLISRPYLMNSYQTLQNRLIKEPRVWLITGVAGFIGSNLLEALLKLGQRVVGLDNFSTGYRHNLEQVRALISPEQWALFHLIEGSICDLETCRLAMNYPNHLLGKPNKYGNLPVDYVLHHAALGSVPHSIEDPIAANQSNIDGFLNMLVAARDAGVQRFVYASSSAIYGDSPDLPSNEAKIGNQLSPYALTKYVNELYAGLFFRTYGLQSIGLRYFNIFGPRQDSNGAYAAVIPKWVLSMIQNEPLHINGDGKTSRDFCYVANVIQANLLAAATNDEHAINQIYNIAMGERISLNDLCQFIQNQLKTYLPHINPAAPQYRDFRAGDIRHSVADINKALQALGYHPTHDINEGLKESMCWYVAALVPNCQTQVT